MSNRRVGFLGSCGTPYCGGIEGYFCVRCEHYVQDCRCQPGLCDCGNGAGWASQGERPMVRERLAAIGDERGEG